MNIAVITTFPNSSWPVYAQKALQSFAQYWPAEIPLMVHLDDDLLFDQVSKALRPQDAIAVGWEDDHKAFVERNKDKDHPTDYRKQAVRFCHKVFAIKRAMDAAMKARAEKSPDAPRYLVWMDADVHTTQPVTLDDIKQCLPKDGDAVAYLGRKDWDHSECGWLAFDLESDGDALINRVFEHYCLDKVFNQVQWHDSWIWDIEIDHKRNLNLTEDKPGMDIWPHSPMGKWSIHYKGPQAKQQLSVGKMPQERPKSNVVIQTKNAIPHEEIRKNISTNQLLIKNWVKRCNANDEEVVIVSAGPMLIAEDVRKENGKRIVAVKHALEPLKKAGVKPWACILLDPREHVSKFVEKPDTDVIWFVASQVQPEVTKRLLDSGCEVWGYHASVGADEQSLTDKQPYSIIHGGSATSTRGFYLLNHLGFNKMTLYGYDLCFPDKPDLRAVDNNNQPKYLEFTVEIPHPFAPPRRCFWTEPQLIAQFDELNQMIGIGQFKIEAHGQGMIPYLINARKMAMQRVHEMNIKLNGENLPSYKELLGGSMDLKGENATILPCSRKKKMPFLTRLPRLLPKTLRKQRAANSF